jgi:hypothetical protein
VLGLEAVFSKPRWKRFAVAANLPTPRPGGRSPRALTTSVYRAVSDVAGRELSCIPSAKFPCPASRVVAGSGCHNVLERAARPPEQLFATGVPSRCIRLKTFANTPKSAVPWLSALAGRSRHAAQHGADVGGLRCIPRQAVFPAGAHEGHRSRSNPLDRLKRRRPSVRGASAWPGACVDL